MPEDWSQYKVKEEPKEDWSQYRVVVPEKEPKVVEPTKILSSEEPRKLRTPDEMNDLERQVLGLPPREEPLGLRNIASMGIRGASAFVPGGPLGALAGGLGEFAAQTIEPGEYNLAQIGTQTGLGFIPFGRVASIGRGLAKGATMGAGAITASELAETGEFPSIKQLGLGAGIGAIGGGIAGRVTRPRVPSIDLKSPKPRMRLKADGTFQNIETGEIFDKAGRKIETPIDKLVSAIEEAKPLTKEQAEIYTAERIPKFARAREVEAEGEVGAQQFLGALKGEHTKVQITPLKLDQNDTDSLFNIIKDKVADVPMRAHATSGLMKVLRGDVPQPNELQVLSDVFGANNISRIKAKFSKRVKRNLVAEWVNLPRSLQASYDLSFGGRQGITMIHTKAWWKSWGDAVKSFGKEKAFRGVMDNIEARPNAQRIGVEGKVRPSIYERAGLKLTDLTTDLTKREEAIMSPIAEAVPGVRRSNRAYVAQANKLRADNFDALYDRAIKIYETAKETGRARRGFFRESFTPKQVEMLDPRKNNILLKQMGSYINNASGRGSLGALEKSAVALNSTLFSPRLVASRLQMMNPANYIGADPFIRKQYLKSMISLAAYWSTMAGLAKYAGAEVSSDPTSADFGKMKIGNTRLDPAGGFQQYLVLAARLASGEYTTSTTGRTRQYGIGFGTKTRMDALQDFIANKLAPIPAYGASMMRATERYPFEVGDRTIRLFTPILIQDLSELAQENPELLPLLIPSAVGMGSQTYGERGESSRLIPEEFFPRESDIRFPAR